MVGDGEGGHSVFFRFFDELGDFDQTVKQTIMCVIMKMDKRHRGIITEKNKYLIGIDEAGRGSLAGPVSVGIFVWPVSAGKLEKVFADYPIGRDSKKLSARQRDFWFGEIKTRAEKCGAFFGASLISHKIIDKQGINPAIKLGIKKSLGNFADHEAKPRGRREGSSEKECLVLLDGGLRAPENFPNQQTIIRGDEKELVISLASIVAKVLRDREMIKLAKKYPDYGWEKNKGYGTKAHYVGLSKKGACDIHRQTYLAKFFKL